MSASGVLYLHSCPPAVCPHVEWAVAAVLGGRVTLSWTAQPASPGTLRADSSWRGARGTGARLAGALRGWPLLRFEVCEEPSPGCDGERYSHTPSLGLFHTRTSANGDVTVGEDRLRTVLAEAQTGDAVAFAVDRMLGTAWDDELESYRCAGEGTPVTWLHEVV